MKRFTVLSGIVFTTILFCFSSCSNRDEVNAVSQAMLNGNWKVGYYFDNTDETSDFASYTFTFNSNGTVQAVTSTGNFSGTWSETSTKLIIDFGTDPILSELNDDWQIEEKTSTIIKLKEDNPAQDDKLHFMKL